MARIRTQDLIFASPAFCHFIVPLSLGSFCMQIIASAYSLADECVDDNNRSYDPGQTWKRECNVW